MTDIDHVTLPRLAEMAREGRRIAMVTAYDASSARIADAAGMDMLLVGDSAAMTVFGLESTLPITMEEMLMLTRAVTRAVRRPFVVADLPFGAYQSGDDEAVRNAIRFVKDAGADAVKLEGAGSTLSRITAILTAGIPVMAHIGLTPQSASLAGGYKTQGRTAPEAERLYGEALRLEDAGCFALVLEAIPAQVAGRISQALTIPTIGIGAGAGCDGQVLVWHDLLGLTTGHLPRFVSQYAQLDTTIREALEAYVADVKAGRFPDEAHSYGMPDDEFARFESRLPEGIPEG